MKYTEQEINDMIVGALKFNKLDSNISSKKKIQALKSFKALLEIDNDYSCLKISKTSDKEKIAEYESRMAANNQALSELVHCIIYLNKEVKQLK